MTEPALAALVAARISHDMASPLGAIANGLELLALELPPSPELALLQDSMTEALARLAMLRLAFGGGTMPVSGANLFAALQTAGHGRVRVDASFPANLPRPLAQCLLLGTMCLCTAMPRGGMLSITSTDEAWTLHATSDSLRIDKALWQGLQAHENADLPPARAHFALLARLSPRRPQLELTDAGARLTL